MMINWTEVFKGEKRDFSRGEKDAARLWDT